MITMSRDIKIYNFEINIPYSTENAIHAFGVEEKCIQIWCSGNWPTQKPDRMRTIADFLTQF